MIIVTLRWAIDPSDMGEGDCAVCGVPFEVEAVFADAYTGGSEVDGPLCTACIEYLGKRNPKWCATLEEFEEARRRYPKPMFEYEGDDHRGDEAIGASFLAREDFGQAAETGG